MLGESPATVLIIDDNGLGFRLASQMIETHSDHRLIISSSRELRVDGGILIERDLSISSIITKYSPDLIVDLRSNDPMIDHLGSARIVAHVHGKNVSPNVITIIPNNIYGPGCESPLNVMVRSAIESEIVPVPDEGAVVRNWVHIDDYVDALDHIIRKGTSGNTYEIGTGLQISDRDIAQEILLKLEIPTSMIDYDSSIMISHSGPRNPESTLRLGWRPKIDLDRGLDSIIRLYRSNR